LLVALRECEDHIDERHVIKDRIDLFEHGIHQLLRLRDPAEREPIVEGRLTTTPLGRHDLN
jgi:hypothetical protein